MSPYIFYGQDIAYLDHDGQACWARLDGDGTFQVRVGNAAPVATRELRIQFPNYVASTTGAAPFLLQVASSPQQGNCYFNVWPANPNQDLSDGYPSYWFDGHDSGTPPDANKCRSFSNVIFKSHDYAPRIITASDIMSGVLIYSSNDTFDYSAMRYNEAVSKSSHNSYESSAPDYRDQFTWKPDAPAVGGNRSFEFDIGQNGAGWTVAHQWNIGAPSLENKLQKLRDQIAGLNPYHDVVTVFLEVKWATGNIDLYGRIDDSILRVFPRESIYTAGDMLGSNSDLATSARANNGWPTLNDLRGKFIFVVGKVEGNASHTSYSDGLTRDRVCFKMKGWDSDPSNNNVLFRNIDASDASQIDGWMPDGISLSRGYYVPRDQFTVVQGKAKLNFLAIDDKGTDTNPALVVGSKPYVPF